MFQFQALPREELKSFMLLPDGEYKFVVVSAEQKTSKNGNAMIEIKIGINGASNNVTVRDWLVNLPSMQYKICEFCDAVGVPYERGSFTANEILGKTGNCILFTESRTLDDGREMKSNKVRSYVKSRQLSFDNIKQDEVNNPPPPSEDDMPF